MKLFKYLPLTILILVTFLASLSPGEVQAQSKKLSSGDYAGKFHYTVYWMMVDNQSQGSLTTHLDYVGNIDIEGTLILSVDKSGKIKPGASILPRTVSTYEIQSFSIKPADCDIFSYLSGESSASIKQNTTATQGTSNLMLAGDLNIANITPLFFKTKGPGGDCPSVPTQAMLEQWTNDHIGNLNEFKTMKFLVVRNTDQSFSGTISIPNVPHQSATPGGTLVHKEDGYFLVYKIDPLAPLVDDSLASLEDDRLAPLGEWRQK